MTPKEIILVNIPAIGFLILSGILAYVGSDGWIFTAIVAWLISHTFETKKK